MFVCLSVCDAIYCVYYSLEPKQVESPVPRNELVALQNRLQQRDDEISMCTTPNDVDLCFC